MIESNQTNQTNIAANAPANPPAAEPRYRLKPLGTAELLCALRIVSRLGAGELGKIFAKLGESGESGANNASAARVGGEVIALVLENLPKCAKEICELLASAAEGVTAEEIEKDAVLFGEILADFVKKEEFPAFLRAARRLLE